MTCLQCGKCCVSVGMPADATLTTLREIGVPVRKLPGDARYYALHGLRLDHHNRVYVDERNTVRVIEHPLYGRMYVVAARCMNLAHDGRCKDYEHRPPVCAGLTRETAIHYIIPKGCAMDPGGMGVDLGDDALTD